MAPGHGDESSKVKSQVDAVYYNQGSPRCCDRMTADIESVSSTVPALSTPPRDYIGKGAAQMPKPFGQKTEKRRPIRFGIGCGLGTRPARVNRIVCGTVSRLADCAKHQAMSTDPLPLAAAAADQLGTTHAENTRLNMLTWSKYPILARIEHPASHPHPCSAAPSSYAQGLPSNMLVQATICAFHGVSPRDRWLCVLPGRQMNVNACSSGHRLLPNYDHLPGKK